MHTPRKCSGLVVRTGSCRGEPLRKAALSKRRGAGRKVSDPSGSFPGEVSDTVKGRLGRAVCVKPAAHRRPFWLPSSSRQGTTCRVSVHHRRPPACLRRRELCTTHLKGIKRRPRRKTPWTSCLRDEKQNRKRIFSPPGNAATNTKALILRSAVCSWCKVEM